MCRPGDVLGYWNAGNFIVEYRKQGPTGTGAGLLNQKGRASGPCGFEPRCFLSVVFRSRSSVEREHHRAKVGVGGSSPPGIASSGEVAELVDAWVSEAHGKHPRESSSLSFVINHRRPVA